MAETSSESSIENQSGELLVKVALIEPNKGQPRMDFNEEQMQELAESIKRHGILQPLLVQKRELLRDYCWREAVESR